MSHERPEILGLSKFQNPLVEEDGVMFSAFGMVTDIHPVDHTFGKVRMREQIFGGELVVPETGHEIVNELLLMEELMQEVPDNALGRTRIYTARLSTEYSDQGGSATALFLSRLIGEFIKTTQYHSELDDKDGLLGTYRAIEKLGNMHAPMTIEQQNQAVSEEVVPRLLEGFGHTYDFLGVITYIAQDLPSVIIDRDEPIKERISSALNVLAENIKELDLEGLLEWMSSGRLDVKLFPYFQEVVKERDIKVNEKLAHHYDLRNMQLALSPVDEYFSKEKGDEIYNFDAVRNFLTLASNKSKEDKPEDPKSSRYWHAAIRVADYITKQHRDAIKNQRGDVSSILSNRANILKGRGIPLFADSMLFVYTFPNNEQLRQATDPNNEVFITVNCSNGRPRQVSKTQKEVA